MFRHPARQGAAQWSPSGFSRTIGCPPDHWNPSYQQVTGHQTRSSGHLLTGEPRWPLGKFSDGWGLLTIRKREFYTLVDFH